MCSSDLPWLTLERHLKILRGLWEHRPTHRFPKITVPVMLTPADNGQSESWAADKRKAIADAERLIPRARTHWFEPADHDLHAQFPERLARHLLDALDDGFFPKDPA